MKALVFNIIINSLYSIRIPFTWQSALTYPILPPSAVIGMLANALQRYKNDKHPLEYLNLIEDNILWAASRLLAPSVIKSYTTSAIVKWEDALGGKFTNALGRQYAYSRKLQITAVFKDNSLVSDVIEALKNTPLTCGDSESPVSVGKIILQKLELIKDAKGRIVHTEYPIPFTKDTGLIEGNGQVYLMHERCKKRESNFPLISYMVPVREEQKILKPSSLSVKVSDEKVFEIEEIGNVLIRES
jgi:CRISPR-associated Cas5-like protein